MLRSLSNKESKMSLGCHILAERVVQIRNCFCDLRLLVLIPIQAPRCYTCFLKSRHFRLYALKPEKALEDPRREARCHFFYFMQNGHNNRLVRPLG